MKQRLALPGCRILRNSVVARPNTPAKSWLARLGRKFYVSVTGEIAALERHPGLDARKIILRLVGLHIKFKYKYIYF